MRKIYSCPNINIVALKTLDILTVSDLGNYIGDDLPEGRIVIDPWSEN